MATINSLVSKYLAAIGSAGGRKGGRSTSPAKRAASAATLRAWHRAQGHVVKSDAMVDGETIARACRARKERT